MVRRTREVASNLEWYEHRSCFRFRYREPFRQKLRYLYCTAAKFREAGLALPSPDAVRKNTKKAMSLAKRLRTTFLNSLAAVRPDSLVSAPRISDAIEQYFGLYSDQSESYRKNLRRIFTEFCDVARDKHADEITDRDLKLYEQKLAKRKLARATVRSNLQQLFMLINFMCKKGWVTRDPRATYKLPKEVLKEPNPFSKQEIRKFFRQTARTVPGVPEGFRHLEWMAVGMLCLGLRPVELEHALWENVNWKERLLFIHRSHGNKMPQACQNQPIPEAAWQLFVERKKRKGLIWTSYFGGPCNRSAQDRARKTLQQYLPEFQWKRFRKTYATILEQAGNDIIVVSRLLRHSAGGKNSSVASRHYVGKSLRYLREVVDDAFSWVRGIGPFPST